MRSALAVIAIVLAAGCGGNDSTRDATPADATPSVRPLTLADVIAPVTPGELLAVDEEWASRDLGAHDVRVVGAGTMMLGTVAMNWRVLEQRVLESRFQAVSCHLRACAGRS